MVPDKTARSRQPEKLTRFSRRAGQKTVADVAVGGGRHCSLLVDLLPALRGGDSFSQYMTGFIGEMH